MAIDYIVARSPEEQKAAYDLLESEGLPAYRLYYPTVIAFEEDEPVGFMSTDLSQGMVVAGPLIVKSDRRRAMTAFRLAEHYEQVLADHNIQSYIFAADEEDSVTLEAVKRFIPDLKPYAFSGGRMFFIRRIGGSDEQS